MRAALNGLARLTSRANPTKRTLIIRAMSTGPEAKEGAAPAAPRPAAPRPPPPRPMAGAGLDPNVQQVGLDKIEKSGLAGVGFIDRGEEAVDFGRVGLAVAGDVAVLLAFAAIGRISHSEALDLEVVATALPFIIGWLGSAPFLGGYSRDALSGDAGRAALSAAKSWAVGMPVGLAIRAISKGYIPPPVFAGISLATTLVLLVGWRAAFAALKPKEEAGKGGKGGRQDRRGNPLEFMSLLISLVKRW